MIKARACYGITLIITFIIPSASRNAKYRKRTEKSLANIDNIVYIYTQCRQLSTDISVRQYQLC